MDELVTGLQLLGGAIGGGKVVEKILGPIAGLSAYQIRSHYIFYRAIKKAFDGIDLNIGESIVRAKMQLYIPYSTYEIAMDFAGNEEDQVKSDLMSHSIIGLHRLGLVENCRYGPLDHIQKVYSNAKEGGIIITPAALGVELLMWAYGYGQMPINNFLRSSTLLYDDQNIKISDVFKVKE